MPGFTNQRIISLANQIASNQGGYAQQQAAQITAEHINMFWSPDMRAQLLTLEANEAEAEGLNAIVRAALQLIKA